MEYVKKTWETGDTITAEALNNIETALAALAAATEPFEIAVVYGEDEQQKETITMNVTAGELYAAVIAGKTVVWTTTITIHEGQEDEHTLDINQVVHLNVTRMEKESLKAYTVVHCTCDDNGAKTYFCDTIGENDYVILTEI